MAGPVSAGVLATPPAALDVRIATSTRGGVGLAGWGPVPLLVRSDGRPFGSRDDAGREVTVLWRRDDLPGWAVRNTLAVLPDLAWVHNDRAGVDDLPLDLLAARNITVTKTAAYTRPVAEWALTGVLVGCKDVAGWTRRHDDHRWHLSTEEPLPQPSRLVQDARVLVVGAGAIGWETARLLRPHTREVAVRGADVALDDYTDVAVLVVACPLTATSRRSVGERQLDRMRPGATVVNVSRGGVVDEAAMLAALDSRQVAAYVCDVWDTEPLPVDSPFWGRPDVLVLPHQAWRARGTTERQVADFAAQLDSYAEHGLAGLGRRVDLTRGY